MRKIALIIALIMILSVPTTAYATMSEEISPFVLRIYPHISFNGKTATCTANVYVDNPNDRVSITMKLWQGNSCIATWSTSGTGNMQFSRSKAVTVGLEYRLTVDVTINGITKPTVSVNGIC
ncbi:MAG: hypothetical protein IKL07_04300 [Clostridium sp.]|nr:hypothetical protein [Clostridium sp.]